MPPPVNPEPVGSVTASAALTATAASKAFPPAARISSPASLAQGLALELAPIRFNVVSPGIIDTPTRAAMPADARKAMLENVAKSLPVKRVGLAEDCAGQILLMLRNTFMTGSVVYIDGGGLLV